MSQKRHLVSIYIHEIINFASLTSDARRRLGRVIEAEANDRRASRLNAIAHARAEVEAGRARSSLRRNKQEPEPQTELDPDPNTVH